MHFGHRIALHVDEDLRSRLEHYADEHDLTMSQVTRAALRNWFRQNEQDGNPPAFYTRPQG
jgi:predicted transcriptional regulator